MGEELFTTEMIFNKRMIELWKNCGRIATEEMAALTEIEDREPETPSQTKFIH